VTPLYTILPVVNRTDEFVIPKIKQINADGKRTYQTPSGKSYPSLTGVTGLMGREGIKAWRKAVGEQEANRVSRVASSRGTAMHNLAEYYVLQNEAKFNEAAEKAMPDAIHLFKTLQRKISQGLEEVLAVESQLYSDELEVAGTVDCIGKYFGKYAVMDWKTSRKKKRKILHHQLFLPRRRIREDVGRKNRNENRSHFDFRCNGRNRKDSPISCIR